jgi:hypothetical protein
MLNYSMYYITVSNDKVQPKLSPENAKFPVSGQAEFCDLYYVGATAG